MNCEKAREYLSRSIDNDLSQAEAAELEEHLKQCADCCAEGHAQRRLHILLGKGPKPTPAADYAARLRQAVRERVHQEKKRPALAFRILSHAAMIALAVVTGVACREVLITRAKLAELQANEIRTFEDRQGGFFRPVRQVSIDASLAEFGAVQDYLGGTMRWMATDGNQVEIGISGSNGATPAVHNGSELIVLTLRYAELEANGRMQVLSGPEFVLMAGEEASVRLRGRDETKDQQYRYRVSAVTQDEGTIRAYITFAAEAKADDIGVDAPITANALLKPGEPLLLGAHGDAQSRRELYVVAEIRTQPQQSGIQGEASNL